MRVLDLLLRPVSFVATLVVRWKVWRLRIRCGDLWVTDRTCWEPDPTGEFYVQIDRALQFIRERDPRRAKWIGRHLNYIVNSSISESGGGEYSRSGKRCGIHYANYRQSIAGDGDITTRAQEVLTIELARMVVHEATHARIDQRGIKYNSHYRERIEKCCHRQEVQFLKRAAPAFRDLFGTLVDWEADSADRWTASQEWYRKSWEKSRIEVVRERRIRGSKMYSEPLPTWKQQHRSFWDFAHYIKPWTEAMARSRATYLYGAHNFAEAAAEFRRLAVIEPDNADTRMWLTASLCYNREYQEALDLWLAIFEEGNRAVAGWISYCQYMLDRHEEALQWYERSAGHHPDAANFRTSRVWPLISTGRLEEALPEFDQLGDDTDAEFGTREFTYRAVHAWLLHELGHGEQFREVRDKVYAARGRWCQCSEAEPVRTRAWVLQVREGIYQPGIESYRAQLLISTEELSPVDWRGFMEQLSSKIIASKTANDEAYQNAYLRSLLPWNDNYPRREVPDELTGGKQVYVVDLVLDRLFLPGGYLEGPTVTCWVAKTPDGNKAALAETYDASDQGLRCTSDGLSDRDSERSSDR